MGGPGTTAPPADDYPGVTPLGRVGMSIALPERVERNTNTDFHNTKRGMPQSR